MLYTITNKRAAVAAVRAEANAIIEQNERRARGFDLGVWRDDMRQVERNAGNTIRATIARSSEFAFALSARFADPEAR